MDAQWTSLRRGSASSPTAPCLRPRTSSVASRRNDLFREPGHARLLYAYTGHADAVAPSASERQSGRRRLAVAPVLAASPKLAHADRLARADPAAEPHACSAAAMRACASSRSLAHWAKDPAFLGFAVLIKSVLYARPRSFHQAPRAGSVRISLWGPHTAGLRLTGLTIPSGIRGRYELGVADWRRRRPSWAGAPARSPRKASIASSSLWW